jgi:hypothetical protein
MSRIELVRDSFVLGAGARRSRACCTPIDFGSQAKAGGVFTGLPAWLSIACASTGRSVQQGPAAVVGGLGANAFRAYSVDGSAFYLLAEGARSNQSDTDLSGWSAFGTCTVSGGTDPTGATSNVTVTSTGGAQPFIGKAMTISAGKICASAWTKNAAVGQPGTINTNIADIANSGAIALPGSDAAYVRREVAGTTAGGSKFSVIQPRTGAGQSGDVLVYGYQIEAGLYPGSVIAAAASRAADVLSGPASLLCPGGYFHLRGKFAPIYAAAEQSVDQNLFFLDSNNRLFLRQSDNKLVLRIGGADLASAALGQSRNQEISVEAVHSARLGRRLIVGSASTTGSIASAISLPATAYLQGGSSGAEEASGLGAIGLFRDAA